MTADKIINLILTFYSPENNGRKCLPDMSQGQYRPHLLVREDPEQSLLGIQCLQCADPIAFETPLHVEAKLPYAGVDYSRLVSGARVLIEEGAKTVGEGVVA